MKPNKNFHLTESATHTKLNGFTTSASVTSDPILIDWIDQGALTAFWTNSGTGTYKLQVSTDVERVYQQAIVGGVADTNIVNWVDIPNSTFASTVGSPLYWNLSNVSGRWLRFVYTVATGTITLSVTCQLKGGL